jgi:hypothetical protein
MYQRPGIRAGIKHALRGAASALIVGLALLGLPPSAARAADTTSVDTTHETQRLTNDAGNDPGAQAALEMIKPALAAMLGRNGRGIEFALYRSVPGMHPLDPTMPGSFEYTLYRKHFHWQLPVWAPAAPVPVRAPPAAPVPVQRRKIDPTTGEEFPERYDYNPYTGQKLVSQ